MSTTKSILLVDADTDVLDSLQANCQSIGLTTHVASDAVTAITLFEKHDPNLICVDSRVSAENGLGLSEMILQSPDDVQCPVIVLSDSSAPVRTETELCVYRVQRRPHLWRYLQPVIFELVDIVDPRTDELSTSSLDANAIDND
ncbi:MAG: response regulator [Pirellulaceae bacterium]|nr:response regulator [Pirellulaceae bacterium]MDP7018909.1 response regulator [Pirellulaceae bacterium]